MRISVFILLEHDDRVHTREVRGAKSFISLSFLDMGEKSDVYPSKRFHRSM